jgi:hypothetical protein
MRGDKQKPKKMILGEIILPCNVIIALMLSQRKRIFRKKTFKKKGKNLVVFMVTIRFHIFISLTHAHKPKTCIWKFL